MNSTSRVMNNHRLVWAVWALVGLHALGAQTVCRAATYYVDGDNPVASDVNPGTEALPWKRISKATPLLQPGETLLLKPGTYRETVILTKSGTTAQPITIQAYPGHEGKAIVNAADPVTNWQKCTGPGDCSGNPQWSHIHYADVAGPVSSHPDKGFAVRQVFQRGERLPRSGENHPRGFDPAGVVQLLRIRPKLQGILVSASVRRPDSPEAREVAHCL